jgi:hypothetical protein
VTTGSIRVLHETLKHYRRACLAVTTDILQANAEGAEVLADYLSSSVGTETGDRGAGPTEPSEDRGHVAARTPSSGDTAISAFDNIQGNEAAAQELGASIGRTKAEVDPSRHLSHSPVSHMVVSSRPAVDAGWDGR